MGLTTADRITEESDAIALFSHFRTIDGHLAARETRLMARFTSLIGKRVEVVYRAGDIHLSAPGALVADSGHSIYLEEHFVQRGNSKTLRTEIPYRCIVRLAEAAETPASNQASLQTTKTTPRAIPSQS